MKRRYAASILVGLAAMSIPASAARLYSTVGGGCVVSDEDIQVANYDTAGFGVKFKGSATGDIRLLCNIDEPKGTFRSFHLFFDDPDGSNSAFRVRALLRHARHRSNVALTVCIADSNTNGSAGIGSVKCDFADFAPALDDFYWFEVFIERSSASANPEFLGLVVHDSN